MTVTVSGGPLVGEVAAPCSKSVAHRLLICAAFADGDTVLRGVTTSQDIEATVSCLQALGAEIAVQGDCVKVQPIKDVKKNAVLDCGESGSTLRFLLPVAAALGSAVQFTGRGRLAERPLSPLYELLCENGCTLSPQGAFPLMASGAFAPRRVSIDGGVSSQFISGLLMAAPLLPHPVEIAVTGAVESRGYIDLTVAALRRFGVTVTERDNVFTVAGKYTTPRELAVEGDWSNAAFWLVAEAICPDAKLTVTGLCADSLQGDRAIETIIKETENLQKPLSVDASQIPDLVPILAVLAAAIPARSVIGNARRLRLKESDRLESVGAMLTALGGTVSVGEDCLVIDGTGRLRGGTVDACNDHRIAMSAAVAACICDGAVTITGAEAVRKSYPQFYDELAGRGMSVCPQ